MQLGSHQFLVDLFVLPLSGAQLVLGVQWLKTLVHILTDYEKLTTKFMRAGQLVEPMERISHPELEEAYLYQLRCLVSTHTVDTVFHLHLISPTSPHPHNPPTVTPPPEIKPPWLDSLLTSYTELFNQPTNLPPPRLVDHSITSINNANLVNVRPYRYPHFKKKRLKIKFVRC